MSKKNCERIREIMALAIEGDEKLLEEVRQHIKKCAVCRLAWNELIDVDKNLAGFAQQAVPVTGTEINTDTLMQRISEEQQSRKKRNLLITVFLILLIAAGITVVFTLGSDKAPSPSNRENQGPVKPEPQKKQDQKPAEEKPGKRKTRVGISIRHRVQVFENIRYVPDSESDRHLLDVYASKKAFMAPVIVFFHGGGFKSGDKHQPSGLYANVGRELAGRGVVTVIPNYRLAPKARYPDFMQDAAAAVKWTAENIHDHGGNPDLIVTAGHNTGATMAMMVALDPDYLETAGADADLVAGVAAVSGIYNLNPRISLIRQAFGRKKSELDKISPLNTAILAPCPVLLARAEKERIGFIVKDYDRMKSILEKTGMLAGHKIVPGRNHKTLMTSFGKGKKPLLKAIVEFVRMLAEVP